MKNGKVHSEEWINKARDYWWNDDYIQLLIKRYDLNNIKCLADVGCGKGYMGFKFAKIIQSIEKIYGIDIENKHIEEAKEMSRAFPNIDFTFNVGDATNINMNDNICDLSVCQTLLLHVNDPLKVVNEMKRITKEGGKVIAIETNNSINGLIKNSIVDDFNYTDNINDIQQTLDELRYNLIIEKGVYNLNEGYLSIGDYVPKLFYQAGLKEIDVAIVDKACSLIPPYDTDEKKARVSELMDSINNNLSEYNYNKMFKYYVAGGGRKEEFDRMWKKQILTIETIKKDILNEKYIMPGGALMYVVTGKK